LGKREKRMTEGATIFLDGLDELLENRDRKLILVTYIVQTFLERRRLLLHDLFCGKE
jgi:hypothetical protein